jgi:hypothetical protein
MHNVSINAQGMSNRFVCLFNSNVAQVRDSVVGRVFAGLDVYTVFAMFLVTETLKEDSFWKPYLKALPTDIGPHPIKCV